MDSASGFRIGGLRQLPHWRSRSIASLAGLGLMVLGHLLCTSSFAEPPSTRATSTVAAAEGTSANAASGGTVLLSGDVKNPGPLQITAGQQMTLSGAILKAGGLGLWGVGHKVRLMRQKNGATETTIVDYDKVTKTGDAKSDPVLQDGDRIFVPHGGSQF